MCFGMYIAIALKANGLDCSRLWMKYVVWSVSYGAYKRNCTFWTLARQMHIYLSTSRSWCDRINVGSKLKTNYTTTSSFLRIEGGRGLVRMAALEWFQCIRWIFLSLSLALSGRLENEHSFLHFNRIAMEKWDFEQKNIIFHGNFEFCSIQRK